MKSSTQIFWKIYFVIILSFFLGFSGKINSAQAFEPKEDRICPVTTEGIWPFQYIGSIVPCGRSCNVESTNIDESKDCTLCHLLILVQNIFNFIKSLMILLAIFFIMIAGIIYIVSTGNSRMKSLAKGIITKTLTGLAIFFLSWMIILTILKFISYNSKVFNTGESFFSFECDTNSTFGELK